jgi:hypothetical protein
VLLCALAPLWQENIRAKSQPTKKKSMIQRIQSVWLLLVAAFDATTFRFPFANGDWMKDTVQATVPLDATTTIWLSVITVITGVLGVVTIFLFGNRKLQLKFCYLGIFLSLVMLTLYFLELQNFNSSVIALWCIFYFAILVCYILAARGILNDQKLIKSMDRLR